jgi:hypothetical protein
LAVCCASFSRANFLVLPTLKASTSEPLPLPPLLLRMDVEPGDLECAAMKYIFEICAVVDVQPLGREELF